jgi:hypothetical protein
LNIDLRVNCTRHELDVEPRTTLTDALRDELGLAGTRLGCEHGVYLPLHRVRRDPPRRRSRRPRNARAMWSRYPSNSRQPN